MSQAPVFICAVPTVNSLVQEVRQQHFRLLWKPARKKTVVSHNSKKRNYASGKSGLRWYCHPPRWSWSEGTGGCIRNESIMTQGFARRKSITRGRIAWEQFHRKSLFLTGRKLFSPHRFCFSLACSVLLYPLAFTSLPQDLPHRAEILSVYLPLY